VTDQPEVRGVALHVDEAPTGLRTAYAHVPADQLPRVRDAVDRARQTALNQPGGWTDVLIVWGRPGKRPMPEALTVRPADVKDLRALLLELDQ
jgi:hypothetical protein